MPFTLAHPAAVLPIWRRLKWTRFSALAIGSMSPDFGYFLPLAIQGHFTHSLTGILLFCVPVSLLLYLLFHGLLKRPLVALLPAAIAHRIDLESSNWLPRSAGALAACVASVAIGAATHVAWDAFTHGKTLPVRHFPWLRAMLEPIPGFPFRTYKLLQHASSLVGLSVLSYSALSWFRSQDVQARRPRLLEGGQRRVTLVFLLGAALAGSVVNWLRHPTFMFEPILFRLVVGAIAGTAAAALIFCAWWHWRVGSTVLTRPDAG